MTIALTTDITIAPVKRVRVSIHKKNKDQNYVILQVKLLSAPAQGLSKIVHLRCDDGVGAQCQRLRKNPNTPKVWDFFEGAEGQFIVDTFTVNNAYTQILAAARQGTDEADEDRRLETLCLSLGILPAEFAGAVG